MSYELVRSFRFEAAHWLPTAPAAHKCRGLHGLSFLVEIHLNGEPAGEADWVVDFAEIDAAFAPWLTELDHTCLNDVLGLENPTCERLARWIWERVQPTLEGLSAVTVHEGASSRITYSR